MPQSVARMVNTMWVMTRDNRRVREITDLVEDAKVSANDANRIPMTLTASLRNPDAVRPFTEYLAPFLKVIYNDGTVIDSQVGLYQVLPPPVQHRRTYSTATLSCADLTWVVDNDAFEGTYSVPADTEYVAAVVAILRSCGLTRISIPGSNKRLPSARSWRHGTSMLTIVNELLHDVSYYPLWIDGTGQAVSRPYLDLTKAASVATFRSGTDSTVVDVSEQPDLTNLANVVIIEKDSSDTGDTVPIVAIRENTSPTSPTSIPSLGGLRIVRKISDSTLVDQAAANALAMRTLQEAQSFNRRLTLKVLPDPRRQLHEVYTLDIRRRDGTVVADGRWWSTAWELGFTPSSAVMTLQLGRIQPFT